MITQRGSPTGLRVVTLASARALREQWRERGANLQRPCKHWSGWSCAHKSGGGSNRGSHHQPVPEGAGLPAPAYLARGFLNFLPANFALSPSSSSILGKHKDKGEGVRGQSPHRKRILQVQ